MPENKSSTEVLAELVLEASAAKQNWFRNIKRAPAVAKDAKELYEDLSTRAENMAYSLLHPLSSSKSRRERANERYA